MAITGGWFPWIDQQGRGRMLRGDGDLGPKQLLKAGVTSAVDLGAPLKESLAVRDRIARARSRARACR